jgi:hypothetical protein
MLWRHPRVRTCLVFENKKQSAVSNREISQFEGEISRKMNLDRSVTARSNGT